MNTKNNKQYINTERRIEEAFILLLSQKHISKITIHDICQNAHISRTTFYVHYKDIYDLLRKLEHDFAIRSISYFIEEETREIVLSRASFLRFFQYIYENKVFFKYLFTHSNNACGLVRENILQLLPVNGIETPQARYQVSIFVGASNMLIKKWLENDCQESPEFLLEVLKSNLSFFDRSFEGGSRGESAK